MFILIAGIQVKNYWNSWDTNLHGCVELLERTERAYQKQL